VNFVVMCLHTKQLPGTIGGMAGLLGESVWEGGVGARGGCEEDGVQDPVGLVLDKLSVNLVEEPRMGAQKEEVPPLPTCSPVSRFVFGGFRSLRLIESCGT
jgi:hypothetical protein